MFSTRIVIDLPQAETELERALQLLRTSETIAFIYRDMPDARIDVQPLDREV